MHNFLSDRYEVQKYGFLELNDGIQTISSSNTSTLNSTEKKWLFMENFEELLILKVLKKSKKQKLSILDKLQVN